MFVGKIAEVICGTQPIHLPRKLAEPISGIEVDDALKIAEQVDV
jgi:hypothetical protein